MIFTISFALISCQIEDDNLSDDSTEEWKICYRVTDENSANGVVYRFYGACSPKHEACSEVWNGGYTKIVPGRYESSDSCVDGLSRVKENFLATRDFDKMGSVSDPENSNFGSDSGSVNARLCSINDYPSCTNDPQMTSFVDNANAIYDNYLRCTTEGVYTITECNVGNGSQMGLYQAYEIACQAADDFAKDFSCD